MMVQLDRFQQINHSLGQIAGDGLLWRSSRRLRATIGEHGLVARFAGDAFMLMTRGTQSRVRSEELAEQCDGGDVRAVPDRRAGAAADGEHRDLGPATVRSTRSDWCVRRRRRSMRPAPAARDTTSSMTASCARNRCSACARRPSFGARSIGHELVMHYQPILNVEDRSWSGVEALVRWQHPRARAAGTRRVHPARRGDWPDRAARQARARAGLRAGAEWSRTLPGIQIAVNASRRELAHPTTATRSRTWWSVPNCRPATLMLEVTESALMAELDTARAVIEQLASLPGSGS